MSIPRSYYVAGERVYVEELDEIVAINPAPRILREEGAREGTRALREMLVEEHSRALEAFGAAGWAFVHRSWIHPEELRPDTRVAKVLRQADGSLALDAKAVSVQLESGLSEEEARRYLERHGLDVTGRLRFAPNLFETLARDDDDGLQASTRLHELKEVLFAEPALIEYIPNRAVPTDPMFIHQWQWHNDGRDSGLPGADVSAVPAWDSSFGVGTTIAILDRGFHAAHEDLYAGVDRARSGVFDGADPATFFPDINRAVLWDHGTFCAGIAGARWNDRGGVGIAPHSTLLLVAMPGEIGTQERLARAIGYAADPSTELSDPALAAGADIICCSLGPNLNAWEARLPLRAAIASAWKDGRSGKGCVIVWAASNMRDSNIAMDKVVSQPGVIAVARTTRKDEHDNRAFGPTLDLVAPGVEVWSTYPRDQYHSGTGNSYAAPCVAGCAALVLSANPDLTADEVAEILEETADRIGTELYDSDGRNDRYGFGRVNAHQAVMAAERRV